LYHEGKLKIKDLTFIAKRVKHIDIIKLTFKFYYQALMKNKRKKLACLVLNDIPV